MLVELVEIQKRVNGSYYLNTIYLNPKHIIYISEDRQMANLMREGKVNLGLIKGATFSKVRINENNHTNEIVVVGEPSAIERKIFKTRRVLRG